MTANIGFIDRTLRIFVGLALLAWALGYIPNIAPSAWGWVGIVPLLTGLLGYCPAYTTIGLNTCKRP